MLHQMHFDCNNGSFLDLEKPPLRSPWAGPCSRFQSQYIYVGSYVCLYNAMNVHAVCTCITQCSCKNHNNNYCSVITIISIHASMHLHVVSSPDSPVFTTYMYVAEKRGRACYLCYIHSNVHCNFNYGTKQGGEYEAQRQLLVHQKSLCKALKYHAAYTHSKALAVQLLCVSIYTEYLKIRLARI